MALSDLFATKKYNMALLKKLNKEYEHKEIMTSVTEYSDEYQINQANQRIDELSKWIDFEGMKILEIGCGGGYVSYQLSQRFSCQVIGIDIYTSEVWDRFSPLPSGVSFRNVDLSRENPFEEDEFDVILSFVAWEHIRHPFEVLQQATKILKPNGLFYILANLYRSAVASHLYKVIFFPFPHLLFEEDIVTKFALSQGTEQWFIDAFYHLNKLTYAQYKYYFDLLKLDIVHEKKSIRNLDMDFYQRFEDKLGLYPIHDLELDFFGVILKKQPLPYIEQRSILIFSLDVEVGDNMHVNTPIKLTLHAQGVTLTYAWYVFCDGERIDTIWYKDSNFFTYIPTRAGVFKFEAFAKDNVGKIKTICSKEYVIETV